MRKLIGSVSFVIAMAGFLTGCTRNDRGEALFKEKCSYCHPDGGNISRGEKGLNQNALRKNNIRNADDIVAYLRRPGPDMPTFDEQSLPVKDAALVAEYIVKNFR
jgi:cytochrome c6